MTSVTRYVAVWSSMLASVCSCNASTDDSAVGGDSALSLGDLDQRSRAFAQVRDALEREVEDSRSAHPEPVTVDATTPPAFFAGMLPVDNGVGVNEPAATPPALRGIFWLRGNPLPDYLVSFANLHLTEVDGAAYGYLSTFAPGSFVWKRKVEAKGAAPGDFKFLPEICRVPKDDPTLLRIARHASTYDSGTFRRPIAEDFTEIAAGGGSDADPRASGFIADVSNAGQLPQDGRDLLSDASRANTYYEAKFDSTFTASTVVAIGVGIAPQALRTLIDPIRLPVPEFVGSFSFAPHMDGDKDVLVRKTFIAGLSKSPNYYFLTRIIDGNGAPTPHFAEFTQCVQERSGGEMLQVVPGSGATP